MQPSNLHNTQLMSLNELSKSIPTTSNEVIVGNNNYNHNQSIKTNSKLVLQQVHDLRSELMKEREQHNLLKHEFNRLLVQEQPSSPKVPYNRNTSNNPIPNEKSSAR